MVEVWDLPLRIFHWALAASVLIAWFSANILDTVHEIAGYTVIVLIAFRIVWGFTGTRYARFRSFVRPLPVVTSPMVMAPRTLPLASKNQ